MKTNIVYKTYFKRKWVYKIISTTEENRKISYCILFDGISLTECVEISVGSNYVKDSVQRSHSRRYDIKKIPNKHIEIINKLKSIHNLTNWKEMICTHE